MNGLLKTLKFSHSVFSSGKSVDGLHCIFEKQLSLLFLKNIQLSLGDG